MIGTLIYMAALGAPDLADAASSAAGKALEGVGKRLAAGLYDEITARAKQDAGSAVSFLTGAISNGLSAMGESVQASVGGRLKDALADEGMAIVAEEELSLLREVAVAAASHGDVPAALAKLTEFHRRQSAN